MAVIPLKINVCRRCDDPMTGRVLSSQVKCDRLVLLSTIMAHNCDSDGRAKEDSDRTSVSSDGVTDVYPKRDKTCPDICAKIFGSFITLYKGWRCYMGQSVRFAGVALSCLYMTVLGFDNITTGQLERIYVVVHDDLLVTSKVTTMIMTIAET